MTTSAASGSATTRSRCATTATFSASPSPALVTQVHRDYLEAGADIITTNTFTATRVSQTDYGLGDIAYEMNLAGARLARKAADGFEDRFVAGSLGPTNVTLSLSPKVDDPSYRDVTFDELQGRLRGGRASPARGRSRPPPHRDGLRHAERQGRHRRRRKRLRRSCLCFISVTIVDRSGRNLSGQTVEAFWTSIEHADPFAAGINCSLGADRDAPLHRGHVSRRARLRRLLSERRPAERIRRVRRGAADHQPACSRSSPRPAS